MHENEKHGTWGDERELQLVLRTVASGRHETGRPQLSAFESERDRYPDAPRQPSSLRPIWRPIDGAESRSTVQADRDRRMSVQVFVRSNDATTTTEVRACAARDSIMILPQVHLRKPCYDFYFL